MERRQSSMWSSDAIRRPRRHGTAKTTEINKIRLIRENGINTDKRYFKQKSYYPYYYEQIDTGFNLRMSDISAALGNSQLKKINFFVNQRNKIAKKYIKLIGNKKFIFQKLFSDVQSSYHLFIVKLFTSPRSPRNRILQNNIHFYKLVSYFI